MERVQKVGRVSVVWCGVVWRGKQRGLKSQHTPHPLLSLSVSFTQFPNSRSKFGFAMCIAVGTIENYYIRTYSMYAIIIIIGV